MAGPALSQLHAHRAIHDGAQSGANDYTEQMLHLVKTGEKEAAVKAAKHLLDYWETRIISHADAEESGFYQKKVDENDEYQESVKKLKRDHEILRIIVHDLKSQIKDATEINQKMIQQFFALLTMNEIHSREEERLLF